ncbi:MAG: hypothetical protein JWO41_644 [Candidatus Saccharibacteria bacterium]|nr:hypothetical protein [Candidatus Saccharibacteria bacterium]
MLNPSWRLRPAVLSETILLQQQRTPKILGWKTLQLAEVTALAEDGLQEALTFDDPQPGLAKRVLAFIMDNDPVLHASKR